MRSATSKARAGSHQVAHLRAGQRLEPDQAVAGLPQLPDRLEGDLDRRAVEQLVQRPDARRRDDHRPVELVEADRPVASTALGLVEGGIGLLDDGLDVRHGRADLGHAAREGRRAQRARRGRPDGVEPSDGAVHPRPRQEQRELVAAEAERTVLRSTAREQSRDADQQRVARLVAVAVVRELEVVEVEHRHAQSLLVSDRQREAAAELLMERGPVPEIGQPVARRAADGRSVQLLQPAPADQVEDRNGEQQADRAQEHRLALELVQPAGQGVPSASISSA
jgi:hypothetical protein